MRKYKEFEQLGKLNETKGFDLELALTTRVLGLESLHHGLWNDSEKLTLENLKKAQARYTQKIIKTIPKGVKTILDVGCGIGDIAFELAKQGYKVTSLSPIEDQQIQYKKRNKGNGNKFILSKYEDLELNETFDLILMPESSNYINLEQGMLQTKRYISQDGYLLVFGIFSRKGSEKFNRYSKKLFVSEAKKVGLSLVKEEDITKKTVKTMEFAYKMYEQYVPELAKVIEEFYQKAFSFKAKLLSLMFKKETNLLRGAITDVIPMRLDPKEFEKFIDGLILYFDKK